MQRHGGRALELRAAAIVEVALDRQALGEQDVVRVQLHVQVLDPAERLMDDGHAVGPAVAPARAVRRPSPRGPATASGRAPARPARTRRPAPGTARPARGADAGRRRCGGDDPAHPSRAASEAGLDQVTDVQRLHRGLTARRADQRPRHEALQARSDREVGRREPRRRRGCARDLGRRARRGVVAEQLRVAGGRRRLGTGPPAP